MKKYTLALFVFAISSSITASENQIRLEDERSTRTTMSDGNLIIPENKISPKCITVSASILMLDSQSSNKELKTSAILSRSPEVQNRLDCFQRHKNSGHNKAFIEKVCAPNNKYYSVYIELIKDCPQCLPIFKDRLNPN